MTDFDILGAASSGMQAQRSAMNILARNVALAQTGDPQHPAHGLVPDFATVLAASSDAPGDGEPPDVAAVQTAMGGDGGETAIDSGAVVAVTGSHASAAPIDSITEMISVLDSQRAYEANASIFDLGKRLSERTIDMGRI